MSVLQVYRGLMKHYKACLVQRPWLQPSDLLESVVESGASLREEMFFRKQNQAKGHGQTPPAIAKR